MKRTLSIHRRSAFVAGIVAMTAIASLASVASAQSTRLAHPGQPALGPASKIKHVILFYQENRSFDEVLGAFCVQRHRCDGYIGKVHLSNGTTVAMKQSPDLIHPDVSHTVSTQVKVVDGGRMDGWDKIPSCDAQGMNRCLTYYTPSQIPALSSYADKYVVADRTFTEYNSPSWGGHVYAVAASQDGFTGDIPKSQGHSGPGWGCDSKRVARWISPQGKESWQPSCIPAPNGTLNPAQYPYGGAFEPTQVQSIPTIMDRLDAKHMSWKLYASVWQWAVCPNFGKCLYTSQRQHIERPDSILTDAKHGTLPAFSVLLPTGPGAGGTGQHPDHPMSTGDNWIGKVVNTLQSSPDWSSTAIFIAYDDCGCFYDHVPPGRNPDGTVQGIRTPMVIVSPYAKQGGTDSHSATLASVLRFTEEAFGLAPLGVNDAKAYDYSGSFNFAQAPTAGRAWPAPLAMAQAELQQIAKIPPEGDGDDPT